jgi:putative peptide zinc metalloprotease protein
MAGWPLYRLFKALHRRGRIPDMKPARVSVSVAVVLLAVTLVLTIPWPVRVAGLGLVQVLPGHAKKVLVPEAGGFLQELRVEDGQTVRQGDVLAVLTNPELEIKLKLNEREQALRQAQLAALAGEALVAGHEGRLAADYQNAYLELEALRKQHKDLREQTELLTLRAPRDGRVLKRIRREEVGKAQERGVLICEVGDDTALRTVMLVETREHLLVHEHRPAWIQVHGLGGHALRGRVAEIASVEAKDIPPQLSNRAGGDIPTMPDPESKAEKPQQQLYLVAVHFEEGESLAAVHPGTLARVKIESDPQTLWWRLRRALNNLNWKL